MTFARSIFILITAALVAACSPSGNKTNTIVKIDGSSTVFPITEAVSEEFQIKTKTPVTVGISGTGGGFKKFCRGETDISDASRPISQKEIDSLNLTRNSARKEKISVEINLDKNKVLKLVE